MLLLWLAALVLIPWALPLNLLLMGSPLVAWKQAYALLLLIVTFAWIVRTDDHAAGMLGPIPVALTAHLSVLLLLCTVSVWIGGIGPRRAAYAALAYGGFASFAVLPALAIGRDRLFAVLCLIAVVSVGCGAGLIADYALDLSGSMYLEAGGDPDIAPFAVGDIAFRRAMFPFDSPSTGYGFLSLGILACQLVYLHATRQLHRMLALVGIAVIYLGGLATLTRAIWLLQSLWILLVCTQILRAGERRAVSISLVVGVAVAVIVAAVLASGDHALVISDRIENAFSSADEGNDIRLNLWGKGVAMLLGPDDTVVLGHGLGATLEMFAEGGPVSTHFESSFFQAYYEGGLAGLALRYWPFALGLASLLAAGRLRHATSSRLLAFWLVTYFAATAIAPTAGSYSGQIALYFVMGCCVAARRFEQVLAATTDRPAERGQG